MPLKNTQSDNGANLGAGVGLDMGRLNLKWAHQLINQLALEGVHHVVISPGSRSTPLALACEKHSALKTWIQVDERCAGFFALGLAQHKDQPVILICTSGSAVANWLPAVVEASHSYTPLILLSADRPEELQNCGANQSMNQSQLFSDFVRLSINFQHASEELLSSQYPATMASQGLLKSCSIRRPGPVHFNIPIREPLLPALGDEVFNELSTTTGAVHTELKGLAAEPNTHCRQQIEGLVKKIETGRGLIICGRLTYSEAHSLQQVLPLLGERFNCPIFLDPLSRLRLTHQHQRCEIINYDHFLRQQDCPEVDWIIRLGQFPVSKNLMLYLQASNSYSILVNSFSERLDPLDKTDLFLPMWAQQFCQYLLKSSNKKQAEQAVTAGLNWYELEQQSEIKIQSLLDSSEQLFEGHVVNRVLAYIPDHSLLYSGNSMAIRDFDTFITHKSAAHKNLDFIANRGLSGIDGNVSSFLGYLADKKTYGVALMGDLTFYHDMNGLFACRQLQAQGIDACIIVINNSGGGIFNYLSQKNLDEFDKLWKTDMHLDFQHAAKLYGLGYTKIMAKSELNKALQHSFSSPGIQLLEIIVDDKYSVECHQKL